MLRERRRSGWGAAGLLALALLGGCKEDKQLKVTGMTPSKGTYLGGQQIKVTGNRFTKDGMRTVQVYFGSSQGHVQKFADTEMTVMAPGGKINETVDVTFYFEPGGVLTIPKAYTFIEEKAASMDDLAAPKKK
jgi:hypothetical protein